MPWLVAGLMAVLAMGVYSQFPAEVTTQMIRTSVIVPGLSRGMFDVSPDGTKVVYSPGADGDEQRRLHLRRLDEDESIPIPGTEMASSPFFSPDGDFLTQWTDLARPCDFYIDNDGAVYVPELDGLITILSLDGEVLARWTSPTPTSAADPG